MRTSPVAALLSAALACTHRGGPRLLHREHPLAGKVWDVREGRFTDEAALEAALGRADFVLLGETHDNPAHHEGQARLVRAIGAAGRAPALALEMLDTSQQPAIDAAVAASPRSAAAIGKAVRWDESGWPAFSTYAPILQAGLDAGMPVVAANVARPLLRDAVKKGEEALPAEVRARIDRQGPLAEDVRRALRAEMAEEHCGELPEDLLDPMILAQRARDAQMAGAMAAAGAGRGAILVTGSGHARLDRGVPSYLGGDLAGRTLRSVAFLEVEPDATTVDGYAKAFGPGALPFDFAVFTPAAEREDPCAALREKMEEKRKAKGPEKPRA